jgi:AcrR family transcriptional regulator
MRKRDPIQAQLIAARRNQILDAATKVFAKKGFHRATIREVAKAADIADGTIYNYFKNKTALLLGILDRLNETPEREAHFTQASKMDIRAWVHGYIRQRFETLGPEGLDLFQVMLSEVLVNRELRDLYSKQVIQPTYALAGRYFRQWRKDGTLTALDPALAMRAIAGMFLGVLMQRLIGDPVLEARWEELPDVMAEIILNGVMQAHHE